MGAHLGGGVAQRVNFSEVPEAGLEGISAAGRSPVQEVRPVAGTLASRGAHAGCRAGPLPCTEPPGAQAPSPGIVTSQLSASQITKGIKASLEIGSAFSRCS